MGREERGGGKSSPFSIGGGGASCVLAGGLGGAALVQPLGSTGWQAGGQ